MAGTGGGRERVADGVITATPTGGHAPLSAVETRLRSLLVEILEIAHPNHGLVLQGRLLLVAYAFESEALPAEWRATHKLAAAHEALSLARRVLPAHDVQIADLLFQIGLAKHGLAQCRLRGGSEHGSGTVRARDAEALLRGAAEAMLLSGRQFAAVLTKGDAAPPAVAARQFASLCIDSIRKLCRRSGASPGSPAETERGTPMLRAMH